ncbi:uncharacterized protein LOC133192906 [Saccostrea echinata]|uniref:uncharacterized protein LOC133192906 n=1 Tax=Saccostrea echinata TaxID=191078 RepID=UPI002A81A51E|nr:uncharacterized protein LOC133192906 [Saccostrea echinata]
MASNLIIIDSDSEEDTEQKTKRGSPERLTFPETQKNEEDECYRIQTPDIRGHAMEEETAASIDEETNHSSINEHRKNISKRDADILSKPKAAKCIEKALVDFGIEAYVEVQGESCLYATAANQVTAELAVDISVNLISEEKIPIPYERKLERQKLNDLESDYLVDIEVQSNVISVRGIDDVSTVRQLIEETLSEKNNPEDETLQYQFNRGPEHETLQCQFNTDTEHQTLQCQFNRGQSRCYKRDPNFISKVTSMQSHNLKVRMEINTNKCLVIEIEGDKAHGKQYLENLKSLEQEIWDGKLDLFKISKDETDVAIMSNGLRKEEKQFIKMAECQLQCGIIVGNSSKKVRLPFQSRPFRQTFKEEDIFSDLPTSQAESRSRRFSDWERATHSEKLNVRGSTIQVLNVDVTLCKAKCLVNFFDSSSGLSTRGKIFERFMKEGGQELSDELSSNYDSSENIIMTKSGGKLQCQHVCHILLPKYRGNHSSIQKLQQAVRECFRMCADLDVYDIAVPALGVGHLLQYPEGEVANLLISESVSQAKTDRQWKITFAIYDKKIFSVFKQNLDLRRQGKEGTNSSKHGVLRRESSVPSLPVHTLGREGQRNSTPDFKRYRDHKSFEWEGRKGWSRPKSANGSPQDIAGDQSKMTPVIELHIYALSRDKGESIRSELSQMIKERFLHEHSIERINFSEMPKHKEKKMYEIGQKYDVFVSLDKGKNRISLKGSVKGVSKAGQEIESICTSASPQEPSVRRENKHRHGTEEYWKKLVEEPPVPTYWKHFKDGKSLFDYVKGLFTSTEKRYEVDPKTFHAIRKLVERTFNPELVGQGADARNLNHKKIHVQKVELIENIDLYQEYSLKRRKMLAKSINKTKGAKFPTKLQMVPGKQGIQNVVAKGAIVTEKIIDERLKKDIISELNEVYLFHGTKSQFVGNIVSKGVDPKHGSDSGMFGRGIYCAESSTKADQYADDKDKRGQKGKMFLMRLLLGHMFLTERDKKYKQPPCYNCYKDDCAEANHVRFDSVVGVKQQSGGLFREFVVYDKDQCYPEYLITYTRL